MNSMQWSECWIYLGIPPPPLHFIILNFSRCGTKVACRARFRRSITQNKKTKRKKRKRTLTRNQKLTDPASVNRSSEVEWVIRERRVDKMRKWEISKCVTRIIQEWALHQKAFRVNTSGPSFYHKFDQTADFRECWRKAFPNNQEHCKFRKF